MRKADGYEGGRHGAGGGEGPPIYPFEMVPMVNGD